MSPDEAVEVEEETEGSGKLKKILIALVALAAVGGGAWFFVLSPAEATAPVPGEVMRLDTIQVNLTGGHYLRLGLALQLTEEAHEIDGAQALDAAIELFSGQDMADLGRPKDRDHLKLELEAMLEERYHGAVMGVYLTEFVTQ